MDPSAHSKGDWPSESFDGERYSDTQFLDPEPTQCDIKGENDTKLGKVNLRAKYVVYKWRFGEDPTSTSTEISVIPEIVSLGPEEAVLDDHDSKIFDYNPDDGHHWPNLCIDYERDLGNDDARTLAVLFRDEVARRLSDDPQWPPARRIQKTLEIAYTLSKSHSEAESEVQGKRLRRQAQNNLKRMDESECELSDDHTIKEIGKIRSLLPEKLEVGKNAI